MIRKSTVLFCLFFVAATFISCNSKDQNQTTENVATTSEEDAIKDSKKKYYDIDVNDNSSDLFAVTTDSVMELGSPVGYINTKGDTIIPIGKYSHCWTDTIKALGYVFDEKATKEVLVAIDKQENILFDVYLYDNWPDQPSDGLFRVKRNDKVGYANEKGEIVIPCIYKCAFPFENGQAKVALNCTLDTSQDEYSLPESKEWIYINTKGKKINK